VTTLDELGRRLRQLPGVRAKADIGLVAEVFGPGDWRFGPGDDGAVVGDGAAQVVAGGEAMLPAFVSRDPYGAGVAAVLANVNDLAAMGARPVALLDTFVGPRDTAREALRGMRWAGERYDVPIVGGHLTLGDFDPSLSAFGIGRVDDAQCVLSADRVRAGQTLVLGCCVQGAMRSDFLFFRSFDERGDRLADDVRLLAELAASGVAQAAKDVSMAGIVGSIGMLLEARQLGITVDLDEVVLPDGVALADWLSCFPCYAFLVATNQPAACVAAFAERGLTARPLGGIDETGLVRLRQGAATTTVFDLTREGVTNLGGDGRRG
jgi:selenophosphate synthetase-related protein